MKKLLAGLITGLFMIGVHNISNAAIINWTNDWTIQATDVATGTMTQNGTVINVTYTGHIDGLTHDSYWYEGTPAPYTGNSVVDNAPTSGITLSLANTATSGYANIITFSAPVIDPVFALYSVGNSGLGVPYEFDQSFSLLSEGCGAWGDGSFVVSGNTITGYEGNGVIQFSGSISSISWNNPVAEYHHGFAIGAPVPIPATIFLLGSGLAGIAGTRFRRKKK